MELKVLVVKYKDLHDIRSSYFQSTSLQLFSFVPLGSSEGTDHKVSSINVIFRGLESMSVYHGTCQLLEVYLHTCTHTHTHTRDQVGHDSFIKC